MAFSEDKRPFWAFAQQIAESKGDFQVEFANLE
jgi:hypothetical protein